MKKPYGIAEELGVRWVSSLLGSEKKDDVTFTSGGALL
jgi:hypothetical protein